MSQQAKHIYEFGPFRIDPAERLLRQDGETVSLAPKAFDLLLALVKNGGHLLEKEELMKQLWPDSFVEEANLSRNVFTLRKALGEIEGGPQYIETVPKRGYRFVAGVRSVLDETADLIVEERFNSQAVLKEKLRGWPLRPLAVAALAVLVGLAVAFSYFWSARQRKQLVAGATVKSIAVLPFRSIGTEGNDESLGFGMADTLITKLSNIEQIVVRPTSAVFQYAGRELGPVAVGREQGVDAVLSGTVRRSDESIRVTVQLVRVADEKPLWGEKFDEPFTKIFAVEDSIAQRVANALTLELTGDEQRRLVKRYTENTEAYVLYQQGQDLFRKRTRAGTKRSIELFEQAIQKDVKYTPAYVELAKAHLHPTSTLAPKEARSKVESLLLKALELDAEFAEAHSLLGELRQRDLDWQAAESELKRALYLNRNSAAAHGFYAGYLTRMGRHDEAIAEAEEAVRLDSLSPVLRSWLGFRLYFARRYDQAIEQSNRAIRMDPKFVPAHARLGATYLAKGMFQDAIGELETASALDNSPDRLGRFAWLAHAYAVSGKRDKAQVMLTELKALAKQRWVRPINFAFIYAGLGEKDQAFAWLEKVYEEPDGVWLGEVKVHPMFDSLRSDPRFNDLMRRAKLAP